MAEIELECDPDTGELWANAGFDYGWDCVVVHDPETIHAHILPIGDTGSHVCAEDCPCCPQMDHEGVWQHRAYDGREAYDTGKAKVS
jgi:hypothetical protein